MPDLKYQTDPQLLMAMIQRWLRAPTGPPVGPPEGSIHGDEPDAVFGVGTPWHHTGSMNDQTNRSDSRTGLPGVTPIVDPRIVNPANNPYESRLGLQRGDINLDNNTESTDRANQYFDELKRRGLKYNFVAPK